MARSRPKIIAVIGIDGSGKSTILDAIEEEVRAQGGSPIRIWTRWRPRVSLPLMGIFRLLGITRRVTTASLPYIEKRFKDHRWAGWLWRPFWLADVWIQSVEFRIAITNSSIVLCDRYAADLVVDAAADIGAPLHSWPLTYPLRWFPSPERVIFVRAQPEVAITRKNDIPSIQYLSDRARLYDDISSLTRTYTCEPKDLEDLKRTGREIGRGIRT